VPDSSDSPLRAGYITDHPLQGTGDTAIIFHDSHVQLDEGLGDRWSTHHRQHTVGTIPESFIEELGEFGDLFVIFDSEGSDKRHVRELLWCVSGNV
jgi:hypothetical protein|tara:strand:+ start:1099 stop:1386 length:288 start_codon:yes stop_codon:yes gene_type:complete